jgi:hypothetical protein
MLGFWPQFLFVLIALYFAGTIFADTDLVGRVVGRWTVFIPVLMGFIPFVYHAAQTSQLLLTLGLVALSNRFVLLSLGLAVLLVAIGLLWAWRYTFSIFVFPFLLLLVYYTGPLSYLHRNLPNTLPLETRDVSLFAVLASLGLLAYTVSYIRAYFRRQSSREN